MKRFYLKKRDGLSISCAQILSNILGSVKIEIKPVNPFGESSSEAVQEKREEESLKDSSRWRESTREPAKPLSDPQIVRDFLMGDHCLYGGTGWWKYEFCYGNI